MFLHKPTTSSTGIAVSHHRVANATLKGDFGALSIWLDSWPSEDLRVAGGPPVANWFVSVPTAALDLSGGVINAVQEALLASEYFSGATILPDAAIGLEAAKTRKWADVKAHRDAFEAGTFTWDGSVFDSDEKSQGRIQGAVQLALIAQAQAQPFSIEWTLADNSSRTVSGAEMLGVGFALAAHVEAAHAVGRALRAQIEAAADGAALGAIDWATAIAAAVNP